MEKYPLLRKCLAVGIILLFIAIAAIPTTGISNNRDDTIPPITTISFNPPEPDGENGWYVSNVTVTLNATDEESGVNVTYYTLNATGDWHRYTEPFLMTMDGNHSIEYYSVDNAGNVEDIKSVICKIDQTIPQVVLSQIAKFNRIGLDASPWDEESGINRVEFYYSGIDRIFIGVDYNEPYTAEFKPIPPEVGPSVIGLILPPKFSEHNVSFYAIIVVVNYIQIAPEADVYDNAGNHNSALILPIYSFVYCAQRLTFCTDHYSGQIGKFFINARF